MLLPFAEKAFIDDKKTNRLLPYRRTMSDVFQLLDVIALLHDLPAEKLRKGSLGTIVEVFPDKTYLVEFADQHGVTYALPILGEAHMLKIYQEPVVA